jgi:hypothetical protein
VTTFADPVELLHELGVTEPGDIDLPVIASFLGAKVFYRPLDGCEARIVGIGPRACITVNSRSAPTRQRFSIAHELGHWQHHRGQALFCKSSEIGSAEDGVDGERLANWYAANLLMPRYLFREDVQGLSYPYSWRAIQRLADRFGVSPLAAALRLVSETDCALVVACYTVQRRRWFKRSSSTGSLFPVDQLDGRSSALTALLRGEPQGPKTVPCATWFPGHEHDILDVVEDVRLWESEAYVLLQPRVSRRRH